MTLIDLSRPMLERAKERVGGATSGRITTIQGDIRQIPQCFLAVDGEKHQADRQKQRSREP